LRLKQTAILTGISICVDFLWLALFFTDWMTDEYLSHTLGVILVGATLLVKVMVAYVFWLQGLELQNSTGLK
jgi:hypothetical protein